jgi:FixJ family two-component response regulator
MRILSPAAGILITMDNHIIAIIDDDALVREGVQRLVSSMNFRAEEFSSTDHFLAFEYLDDVQCVICDVNTSGGVTEPLLHRLASTGYDIPIVFMTALPSAAMRARLMGAGAVCILTKPFHQNEMASCIAAALERRTTKPQRTCARPPPRRRSGPLNSG